MSPRRGQTPPRGQWTAQMKRPRTVRPVGGMTGSPQGGHR